MAASMTKTVQSAQAATGSISNSVTGTGTLAEDDAEDISIPTGITIDKILVESGDTVTVGQALATVDETSVKTAIAEIQTSLSAIDTQIEAIGDSTEDETVTATVSGRVKQIYIASGDNVSDVMLQFSSLMVISADGKMAVDLNNSGALSAGDSVTVTLSDGTEEAGTVASAAGDTVTIILTDDGPEAGDTVSVKNSSGTAVGSGVLYVHQPYQVTGTSGTVSDIYVSENEEVDQGDSLFYLDDVADTTQKDELLAEREDLTKAMNDMMQLEQKGEITATAAGTIESINVEEGTEVTKSSSSSSTSSSSATGGTTAGSATKTAYETGTGSVSGFTYLTAGNSSASALNLSSESLSEFSAAMNSSGSAGTESSDSAASDVLSSGSSTETVSGIPAESGESASGTSSDTSSDNSSTGTESGYTVIKGELNVPLTSPINGVKMTSRQLNAALASAKISAYSAATDSDDSTKDTISWDAAGTSATFSLIAADGYCFDGSGNNTLTVKDSAGADYSYTYYLSDSDADGYYDTMTVTMKFTSADSSSSASGSPASSNASGTAGTSGTSGTTENMTGNTSGNNASAAGSTAGISSSAGSGSSISGGTSASSSSGTSSSTGTSSSSDLYSQYETTGFTVQTNKNMKITISVDELDILSVSEGEEADITLDALENQTFTGTVTAIDTTGSNSGGVSKFTVTITVPKEDDMLPGMSASASIIISSADNVLTIPAAALQESGGESYVYTSEDSDGKLSGKTTVETGLSNDSTVEITSGLTEGQTIYYKQSAGEDISASDESTSSFGGMMGGGGNMGGGGTMPSGGGTMPSGGGQGGPGGNG